MVPTMAARKLYTKTVTMGLGEAIRRLILLDKQYGAKLLSTEAAGERELLAEALDQYPINITMACNDPDVDTDIGIFATAAATSCCRADLDGAGKKPKSARPKERGVKKLFRKRK